MKRELKVVFSLLVVVLPHCFRRCPDEEGTESPQEARFGSRDLKFQKVSR